MTDNTSIDFSLTPGKFPVLECAGWRQNSCDDGPGVRSVLFLQGCTMNCPGCQNKSIRQKGLGALYSVNELAREIHKKCKNKRITISGGEPLEQAKSLIHLLKILRREHFDICLYTGWELKKVPRDIIENLTYLKTGNFKKNVSIIKSATSDQATSISINATETHQKKFL